MKKRFALAIYARYWQAWRGVSLILLVLSLALLALAGDAMRAYRDLLLLTAGLGALTFVLGLAMSALAFVAVGSDAVVVQLPFWRIRLPLEQIYATRLVTLDGAAPGAWRDRELAAMSAVLVELREWPQSPHLARVWLGKLVQDKGLILPVSDTLGLRRAVDGALQERQPVKKGF
jgi:hypothetical protein